MILLLYSGGKDSKKIYDIYVKNRTEFIGLHFYSEKIKKIKKDRIHNIFIPGADDQTTDVEKLQYQDERYLYTALGFAKARFIKKIAYGLKTTDLDKDFLKSWIPYFLKRVNEIAKENDIEVITPLCK